MKWRYLKLKLPLFPEKVSLEMCACFWSDEVVEEKL